MNILYTGLLTFPVIRKICFTIKRLKMEIISYILFTLTP